MKKSMIKNRYKGNKIKSYKNFKKDNYKYRVDEILENLQTNDVDLAIMEEESKRLYKEIANLLDKKGKSYLLEYLDVEMYKRIHEEYTLAEQIYNDLER